MDDKRTTCPKCAHEQDYTDECVKCGVIIAKYIEIAKRPESERNILLTKPEETKSSYSGNLFDKILESIPKGIVILLILFGFTNIFDYWLFYEHRKFAYISSHMGTLSRNLSFFISGYECDQTCCTEWLDDYVLLDDRSRRIIDEQISTIIFSEPKKKYGFLVAKKVLVKGLGCYKDIDRYEDERTVPIIICKTEAYNSRTEGYDNAFTGSGHMVFLNNYSLGWITAVQYENLDHSLYMDLETLLKKYNNIKNKTNSSIPKQK